MSADSYRGYVLGVLTLVYTLNYLDRGLITLLLPQIQADLELSDTQLGFLTGIAFGLFYAILGVPIARWSDRGDRSRITSLAIGLWGATVMATVLVSNFAQLVAARVAAAVGEAGCMPPTYSLIGDYFPKPAERTRAISFYMLANPLSVLLSFGFGGWLATILGWRVAFFLMGTPALLVAALVRFTVRDPRASAGKRKMDPKPAPPLDRALLQLWQNSSTRHLSLGIVLLLTVGAGLGPWYATFLTRYHALETQALGYSLGIIFSVGGLVGVALGGYLSARWYPEDEQGQMRLIALAVAAICPTFALFLLLNQTTGALAALALLWVLFNFSLGPTFALLQRLVTVETRATSMALVLMMTNLIGMGLAPQLVGFLSDVLKAPFGLDSLRYAMLLLSFVGLWAAHHFWRAGKHVRADLRAVVAT